MPEGQRQLDLDPPVPLGRPPPATAPATDHDAADPTTAEVELSIAPCLLRVRAVCGNPAGAPPKSPTVDVFAPSGASLTGYRVYLSNF